MTKVDSKNFLNEWYGYDKTIVWPESEKIPPSGSRTYYKLGPRVSQKVLEYVNKQYSFNQDVIVRSYFPESDGFTDEDFISWATTSLDMSTPAGFFTLTWRNQKASNLFLESLPEEIVAREVFTEFNNFFPVRKGMKRNDLLFRSIEINEFVHRGSTGQTLENFLSTDKEYRKKCRELHLEYYSPLTLRVFDKKAPKFFSFGTKVPIKARNLLLPLTVEQMIKILDYKSNPYGSTNLATSHTFNYVELYIDAALGKVKRQTVKEYSQNELQNKLSRLIMTSSPEFWRNIESKCNSNKKSLVHIMNAIAIMISELNFNNSDFSRGMSYLIDTGELENLNAAELIAVIHGYNNENSWATVSSGKSNIETITELMIDDKLSPKLICSLISFVVMKQEQRIIVKEDMDWSIYEDTLTHWIHAAIPQGRGKSRVKRPKVLEVLLGETS